MLVPIGETIKIFQNKFKFNKIYHLRDPKNFKILEKIFRKIIIQC